MRVYEWVAFIDCLGYITLQNGSFYDDLSLLLLLIFDDHGLASCGEFIP